MNNKENLISIRIIGLILLLSIFLQINLGAWVRLTGSECQPDWPICHGYIFLHQIKSKYPKCKYSYFQIFLEGYRVCSFEYRTYMFNIFLYLIIKKFNYFLKNMLIY